MTSPLDWIDDALAKLRQEHLLRELVVRETPQSAMVRINGRDIVNFSANDYLGLAAEPSLGESVRRAIQTEGWGAGASPLVTGRGTLHAKLEQALASFEGTEAALLFPSGFAANAGTIPALVRQGDVVLSDQKNHASIIDGCRLSRAEVRVYPHVDVDALARELSDVSGASRRLIVTDGLFSMDGDLAPLADICQLADAHHAMVLVDEAHATGVFGDRGRGICEFLEVESRVDIRIGTLSKALGTMGAFVAGRRPLIDWLANRARPYVFSTAAPSALCAAGMKALEIVEQEPHRRERLLSRASDLRDQLAALKLNFGNSSSQIIPIVLGDPRRTIAMSKWLNQRGFHVPGIRPPTVPQGQSQLRISLSYNHLPAMTDRLVETLAAYRES